ncbi:hypothetical protein [Roseateles asaccharophilus]|uniref:PEP-CTERM sorting domain-containing protein n=1 Tax=Roseateles asaccharophilus TaxID=582607 RepID=A0ABU2AG70_9BURK|nr:hypothetical protein [Roseateles asaccharophilus]MDR7335457.1 hypothetical protein [Roseateles asaccharophilus]
MNAMKKLCLAAALTTLTVPAWAALTYVGTGSYNLGSSSGPGGTAAPTSACGTVNGQDALEFTGAGTSNIGIHAYACDDSVSNFGSRASGDGTYYSQGIARISGTLFTGEDDNFAFAINPGEVGAFGSTAFGASEFQKAKLTIRLVIDGTTYFDEAWSAEVVAGGVSTGSSYDSNGSMAVGFSVLSGSGYYSFGINGGSYELDLGEGEHDIFYEMVSEAWGQVSSTGVCTAVLQDGGRVEAARFAAAAAEGPVFNEPFTSYCGAGARSGDPFALADEPIARALALELPEPMSAGLTLTALLAAFGVRRRSAKR